MAENEINKVNVLIRRFIFEVDGILDDKDACQKWLVSFAKTLQFQDLYKGEPNEYALFLLREANDFNAAQRRKIQVRYARKSLREEGIENPTREQIDAMIEKMASASEYDGENELSEQRTGVKSSKGLESAKSPASTRSTGGKVASVPPVQKAPSEPEVLNLAYAGKNGLVRLTDDEYALLLQELGNKRKADRLIDDLDYKLAEGATFRQPHLHVLTHWQSYREDKAAEAAEMAKSRAAANAEAFGNVDRRTPFQKNQDELHQLYVMTSEKLKELK